MMILLFSSRLMSGRMRKPAAGHVAAIEQMINNGMEI